MLFVFAIFLIASFFWGKSCNRPETPGIDTAQLEALQDTISSWESKYALATEEDEALREEIVKLRELKPPLHTQIARIDSNIAKDSTQAVLEARKQLIDLDVPDIKLSLNPFTNYEYAATARLLSDIKPMQLRIKWYDRLDSLNQLDLKAKDKRISSLESLRGADHDLQEMTKNYAEKYKGLYEETQGFFYDRFNISLSAGAFWNGYNVFAGVGITAGISIWNSE